MFFNDLSSTYNILHKVHFNDDKMHFIQNPMMLQASWKCQIIYRVYQCGFKIQLANLKLELTKAQLFLGSFREVPLSESLSTVCGV
jgi:hypothetical protein